MTTIFLIIGFLIAFLINNVIYFTYTEKIFGVQGNKYKVWGFSLISGVIGTVLLYLFGSMSSLGYFLMLVVFLCSIMGFYREQSLLSKLACVFSFNLHIMCSRAIITSIVSLITGETILELSQNQTTFWALLILTSAFSATMVAFSQLGVNEEYSNIITQRDEYLAIYVLSTALANVYMIFNGNVYIHEITYDYLAIHQLIAAFTWLFSTYIAIVALVILDRARARREQLEKDAIFKTVVEKRSLAVITINCSTDEIVNMLSMGVAQPTPEMTYSEYLRTALPTMVKPDELEEIIEKESSSSIMAAHLSGIQETSYEGQISLNGVNRWIRSTTTSALDPTTGDIMAVVTVTDDIHEAKVKEEELKILAERDPLTGLLNKKAIELHIQRHLDAENPGALFMIDLDNFKAINDNFGHAYGDDVLREVSEKIITTFRSDDLIGRIGGDEFMVLFRSDPDTTKLAKKANTLCESIRKVYSHDGHEGTSIEVSASVGITVITDEHQTFQTLYHQADLAMYACKKETKNGFNFF